VPSRRKSRQTARLNRLHPVRQTTRHRELGNVRITEHLQVRLGKLAAQGGNGRQRENEIADGPARMTRILGWTALTSPERRSGKNQHEHRERQTDDAADADTFFRRRRPI